MAHREMISEPQQRPGRAVLEAAAKTTAKPHAQPHQPTEQHTSIQTAQKGDQTRLEYLAQSKFKIEFHFPLDQTPE
jgi:hypothetical protein